MKENRRAFLSKTLPMGLLPVFVKLDDESAPEGSYTILFQGDSITDGNRTRNNDWNHVMGHGFAFSISSRLWADHPDRGFHFFNRGISGNKVVDLAGRWQKEALDLKPDLVSILVGINDISAYLKGNEAMSAENYEKDYRELLKRTVDALPGVQLVLCEPFILKVGGVAEKWEAYLSETQKRQAVVRKLAAEFNAVFLGFQQVFDQALKKAPAEYWIWDGIHPMPAGHELMAREWIRAVGRKLKFIR
ncbi:lysophospholipase [Emticicia sp. CRIBPO]|uniref:SGNH/GDSL hydrolase family protein n=1 Tax=Emticicia sp. CRIBPO TaxID=2683258 RepID=UPI0014129759|nr:SGNH/GDSL hydrolase family protein [Emticicia sp. CRIBPO]NBA84909.1 lysophospholipase [Emticicia sp. CRIBPO]